MAPVSLPLDVIHTMLEVGADVDILKTCRFVSKSWNEICCRILRKTGAAPLYEKRNLEKFINFFRNHQLSLPNDRPSPFQNFKMLHATFSTQSLSLTQFFEPLNFKITTLDVVHGKNLDPQVMGRFLAHHKEWITHLKIKGTGDATSFLALSEDLATNWKSLKSVSLKDECREGNSPCPHMQFITTLTGKSQVKEIILKGYLQNLTTLFSQNKGCWGKLATLDLKCRRPPLAAPPEEIHEFMRWGQELRFPSMKILQLRPMLNPNPYQASEKYAPYLCPLIQDCSESLVELRCSFLSLNLLPSCPKLKSLCCTLLDGDRIQNITELKFPSLVKIDVHIAWNDIPFYVSPESTLQNQKIGTFSAVWQTTFSAVWQSQVPAGALDTLWATMRDHFPKLKALLIQPSISMFTLNLVIKHLPQLEDLEIRHFSSQDLLRGDNGAAMTAKGWPIQYIEKSPLFQLLQLTNLSLGSQVHVSRESIATCLSKLPKLKFLLFHWNHSLITTDIPLYLGHIEKIKILCDDSQERGTLKTLATTMANLTVGTF